MGVPPSANPNALGVVGGDLAGYPNGRRLADDVTDISLKAVAGAAYPLFHPDFKPDPLAAQLGDGVDANDVPFRSSFPYVAIAHHGTSSVPHGVDAPAPVSCPPAPASTPCPPAPVSGGGTTTPPGMPKTGTPFIVEHLGDIYGLVLGAMVLAGGAVLMGGYALRRRSAQETTKK